MKNSGNFIILKRLVAYILRLKKHLLLSILFLLSSSFISFLQPLLLQALTDRGLVVKDLRIIITFSLTIFFSTIIWRIMEWMQSKYFSAMHTDFSRVMHNQSIRKIVRLPIDFFARKTTAELSYELYRDIDSVTSIVDSSVLLSAVSFFRVIGGIIGLSLISTQLTILVVLAIPLKFLLMERLSEKKANLMQDAISENSKFFNWYSDIIAGVKEIKLWNMYDDIEMELKKRVEKTLIAYKQNILHDQKTTSLLALIDSFITCLLYILGGIQLCRNSLSLGSLFAFLAYSSNTLGSISMVVELRYFFSSVIPSAQRIFNFLDLDDEDVIFKLEASADKHELDVASQIAFRHVDFCYDENNYLLKDVNFDIYSGDKVAIIGQNGAGKSTLVNLLLGFYTPISGSIYFNGIDIKQLSSEDLRKKFSVVTQNPHYFCDSIENNIVLNTRPHSLDDILKLSGVHQFATKFKEYCDYIIGQNGEKLSAGERQKLAIARALNKPFDVLIFDEASSNVDENTIPILYNSIFSQFPSKTIIVITHDQHHLAIYNKILSISDGRIIEIDNKVGCK